MGAEMRLLVAATALLTLGGIFGSIAALVLGWSSFRVAQHELRCERPGPAITKVDGKVCGQRKRGPAPNTADLEQRLSR